MIRACLPRAVDNEPDMTPSPGVLIPDAAALHGEPVSAPEPGPTPEVGGTYGGGSVKNPNAIATYEPAPPGRDTSRRRWEYTLTPCCGGIFEQRLAQ